MPRNGSVSPLMFATPWIMATVITCAVFVVATTSGQDAGNPYGDSFKLAAVAFGAAAVLHALMAMAQKRSTGDTQQNFLSAVERKVEKIAPNFKESLPERPYAASSGGVLIRTPEATIASIEQASKRAAVQGEELTLRRAAFDAAAGVMLVADSSGRVKLVNKASERFFDRPAGSIIGKFIDELFTQSDALNAFASAAKGQESEVQIKVVSLLRSSSPMSVAGDKTSVSPSLMTPASLVTPQSGPSYLTNASAVPGVPSIYEFVARPLASNDSGQVVSGVLITLRDITQLALADQLKTDFVANASHELRTPLSSIRAAIETMAEGAWDDEHMRERLARMVVGNIGRLEDLVRDLLDLSKLESGVNEADMQVIAVSPFLEEICQAFDRFTQERGIRIEIRNTTGTLHIRTDPKLLDLVLRNLVDNATKFAFEKTAIVVGVELMPQASGSPGVRFSVVDRGIGIPLAHQQRIFERFYQADTARTGEGGKPSADVNIPRGTGLGLAIVKHALKNLDGSIRVESVWKQGTTMIVEIPGCVVADVADQDDQLDLVKVTKTY